jgi:hypothetical protein
VACVFRGEESPRHQGGEVFGQSQLHGAEVLSWTGRGHAGDELGG